MSKMRAKMRLNQIQKFDNSERFIFNAVGRSDSYPADGSDEDNTYAKYSPDGKLEILVANPALIGQFQVGQKFYVDFTEAPN
jgi:hypothetical protein